MTTCISDHSTQPLKGAGSNGESGQEVCYDKSGPNPGSLD